MRICEAFKAAGFWFRVSDYQFRLTCTCGVAQELDGCATSERDGVTLYACPHCGEQIAGIAADDSVTTTPAPPGSPAPDDEGHRMCGYVFGAKVDMELWPAAAIEPYLEIPRRPGFFASRKLT